MPAVAELLAHRAGLALDFLQKSPPLADRTILEDKASLVKRVSIPYNSSSPAGLIEADTVDPWSASGKYALDWVAFSMILLFFTTAIRWYHYWNDKVRVAHHKEAVQGSTQTNSPMKGWETAGLSTDRSTRPFFPRDGSLPPQRQVDFDAASPRLVRDFLAMSRYLFYHPIPNLRIHPRLRPIVFPSIATIMIVVTALAFVVLYSFVPPPLYWDSIAFGSPPLAIRSGMIGVALLPWIIGLSMKANIISLLTGIGHERLNVLHRWLAYIFLVLSIIHTVPFYVAPAQENGARQEYEALLRAQQSGTYIYGTGRHDHRSEM